MRVTAHSPPFHQGNGPSPTRPPAGWDLPSGADAHPRPRGRGHQSAGSPLGFGFTAAARFLREQQAWLADALRAAPTDPQVQAALEAHEASHPNWISLIAAADAADSVAADELARLYGLHGRVAGSLERGAREAEALPPDVHREIRELLARWLARLTRQALAALRAPAEPPSAERPRAT